MQNNSPNSLKELFYLFTEQGDIQNSYRPYLCNPFKKDGHVFASDSFTIISIPESECDFEFENNSEPIDVGDILDLVYPRTNPDIVSEMRTLDFQGIDFEKYKTQDEKLPYGKDVECVECGGEGKVEWEYTTSKGNTHSKDFDCPICHGEGLSSKVRYKATGKKIIAERFKIKICGQHFSLDKVYKVIEAQKIIGGDIKFIIPKPQMLLCQVGNIRIVIMGLLEGNYFDEVILEIE